MPRRRRKADRVGQKNIDKWENAFEDQVSVLQAYSNWNLNVKVGPEWQTFSLKNLHGRFKCSSCGRQVSISRTFYVRLFRTIVSLYLHFRFALFLALEYWRKCAHKMLVKLTTVDFKSVHNQVRFGVRSFENKCQCLFDIGDGILLVWEVSKKMQQ